MSDIILRQLSVNDLEIVRSWRNSPDVASYMYNDHFISEEQQQKWFENICWKTSDYWVIVYQDKPLGLASINHIDHTLQSCFWAFYLGDMSVRGGGVGAKVEYKVLEHVFTTLKLNKLRCEVFVSNDKVIKMHEKFGFRREGYYREHCIKGKQKLDVVALALLKSEWDQLKGAMKTKIYGQ